jgi:hypothetical protein
MPNHQGYPRYIDPNSAAPTEPLAVVREQSSKRAMPNKLRRRLVAGAAAAGLLLGGIGIGSALQGGKNESPAAATSTSNTDNGEKTMTLAQVDHLTGAELTDLATMTPKQFAEAHPDDAKTLAQIGRQVLEANNTDPDGRTASVLITDRDGGLTSDPQNPLLADIAKTTAQLGNADGAFNNQNTRVGYESGIDHDPASFQPDDVLTVTGVSDDGQPLHLPPQ